MNHTRLWVAATIIALVVIIGFVLSVPHTRDVAQRTTDVSETASVPLVTLHDVFKKGTHTITGTVTAPNACAAVTATASLVDSASSTQNILVEITLPSDTGICLEVPTRISFQTTLAAPARLPITATVNGAAATTTVS